MFDNEGFLFIWRWYDEGCNWRYKIDWYKEEGEEEGEGEEEEKGEEGVKVYVGADEESI